MSKWTGYSQEQKHWSDVDKKAMASPAVVRRVTNAFAKTPYDINIYFYQSDNPDYDRTATKGRVDVEWMTDVLGEEPTKRIIASSSDSAINFVITNNLSDEMPISIASPWMVAHRLSHAILGGDAIDDPTAWVEGQYERLIYDLLEIAYDHPRPEPSGNWQLDDAIRQEYKEAYGKAFGEMLGTMKSAREGHVRNFYEWIHESFSQWLISGKLTMNLNLRAMPHDTLTSDPKKLLLAKKTIAKFYRRMESRFASVMDSARGGYWVG